MSAEHGETGDDVVPRLDVVDTLADRLDDPGRLMTCDQRCRVEVDGSVEDVLVAVAYPCRGGPHKHLARAWRVDFDVFDLEAARGFS
jgi:hypothetical protein